MTRSFPALSTLLVLSLAMWAACTKPTPFGSELLDDQVADYDFVDTFSLQCYLEREDSIASADLSSSSTFFICGQLNDPVFGKSVSEIFTLARLQTLNPDFSNTTLDSVVLLLKYSAGLHYGDTLQPQTLQFSRLSETLDPDKTYYTTDALAVGETLGQLDNFMPMPSLRIPFDDTSAAASRVAHLRVRLNDSFGEEILQMDSLDLLSDTAFFAKMRGFRISTAASTAPGAMLGFDLNDRFFSVIRLYYTKNDTLKRTYDLEFVGSNKFTRYQHDYAGTDIQSLIGNPANNFVYLQGMTGIKARLEVPFANIPDNIIVNKADLVLTVANLDGDNPLLGPANQLVLTRNQGDTTQVFISDVSFSLGPTLTGGFALFGGNPETRSLPDGSTLVQYRMNLSQYFQRMVDDNSGDIRERTLFINVYPQRGLPERTVIFGPNHSAYPAKIELKYTRLQ